MPRKTKTPQLQTANNYLILGVVLGIIGSLCAQYLYDMYSRYQLHHLLALISAIVLLAIYWEIKNLMKE